jgi:hypothetical protein
VVCELLGMNLTGITVDVASAKHLEDGFFISRSEDFYNIRFAVVNVGSKISSYENLMTGVARSSLYPKNGIHKSELSFCSDPRDALIMSAKVDGRGKVQRFTVEKGMFASSHSYTFDDVVDDPSVCYGYELMNIISSAGLHSSVYKSYSLSQLMQNIVAFFSLELFTYMVDVVGLSVFHAGINATGILGGDNVRYRPEVGRLYPLDKKYGLRVVNGEGSVVSTQMKKGSFLSNADRVSGIYFMPFSSPFRDDYALLNQIIINAYLAGKEPTYISGCDYGFVGPNSFWRESYLKAVGIDASLPVCDDSPGSIDNLKGKLLKSAISILVADGVVSSQLDSVCLKDSLTVQDRAYLCAFYFATNTKLPSVLSLWIDMISMKGAGCINTFYNVISGMDFVNSYAAGGVVTYEINNRIYEVDDCGDTLVRLLRKIKAGLCRSFIEIPKSVECKIKLYEKLVIDGDVVSYLNKGRS